MIVVIRVPPKVPPALRVSFCRLVFGRRRSAIRCLIGRFPRRLSPFLLPGEGANRSVRRLVFVSDNDNCRTQQYLAGLYRMGAGRRFGRQRAERRGAGGPVFRATRYISRQVKRARSLQVRPVGRMRPGPDIGRPDGAMKLENPHEGFSPRMARYAVSVGLRL